MEIKRFEIRGKEFKIDLINNYCTKLYSEEFIPAITELGQIDIDKEIKDRGEKLVGLKGKELREGFKTQGAEIKEIQRKAQDTAKKVCTIRAELLQELLESNNYEYDEKWWNRRTSVEDINDFVLTCMKPGYKITDKKKVEK